MLFLVVLFLFKKTSIFQNTEMFQRANTENGLTYGDLTLEDLVNKDTDGDGIIDWQESLYGLDPTKKETTPGTPDSSVINKLRAEHGNDIGESFWEDFSVTTKEEKEPEKLTQTEQFSRELFATVAATSQSGVTDPATIDAISASLVTKIQNPVVRKVFSTSDIKIINDNGAQAEKDYYNAIKNIETKYPINEDVMGILQRFSTDPENVDPSILRELDPAVTQMQNIINATSAVSVPQSLSPLHLNVLNAGERLMENISDMRLFESDPIVAMGAMSKFAENVDSFQESIISIVIALSKNVKIKL